MTVLLTLRATKGFGLIWGVDTEVDKVNYL